MHVLRQVHGALVPEGLALDVHPLALDFAVLADGLGLGFVDTRRFSRVIDAMNDCVEQVVSEGLFEEVRSLRRRVAERFDSVAEVLEEAESWEHLRLPAGVRRKLQKANANQIEFVDTIRYRLLRKRDPVVPPISGA